MDEGGGGRRRGVREGQDRGFYRFKAWDNYWRRGSCKLPRGREACAMIK